MATIYCTATNTGKGFITHEEQENANPLNAKGFPGDVWGVEDNATGQAWQSKVGGVVKTKAEAQAIVDAEVQAAQADYDALTEEQKADHPVGRPQNITLEE